MPDANALLRGGVALVTGVLHLGVGILILKRRDLPGPALTANRFFGAWWFGLALLYLTSGPMTIAYAFGWRDLPLALASIDALFVMLCVALWGIMSFLVYVYAGTNRWAAVIGAFYAALAFVLLWLMEWLGPTGFADDPGRMQFVYARELGGVSSVVLGLLFSVPIFVAAVAYLLLLLRVHDRAARYRIAMVGGAIAFQFGWSMVSSALGLARRFPDSTALQIVTHVIPIVVPIVITLAYRPPPRVRRWLSEPRTPAPG